MQSCTFRMDKLKKLNFFERTFFCSMAHYHHCCYLGMWVGKTRCCFEARQRSLSFSKLSSSRLLHTPYIPTYLSKLDCASRPPRRRCNTTAIWRLPCIRRIAAAASTPLLLLPKSGASRSIHHDLSLWEHGGCAQPALKSTLDHTVLGTYCCYSF